MRAVTVTIPDDLPNAARDAAASHVRGLAVLLERITGEKLVGEIALEPCDVEPINPEAGDGRAESPELEGQAPEPEEDGETS